MNKTKETKAWAVIKDDELLSLKPSKIPLGVTVFLVFPKRDAYSRVATDNVNGKLKRVEIRIIEK